MGLVRRADKRLVDVAVPQAGNDRQILSQYTANLEKSFESKYSRPNKIEIDTNTTEVADKIMSLAITYDPNWKIIVGKGKVFPDALGNLAVVPESIGEKKLVISYQESWTSWGWGVLMTIFSIFLLIKVNLLVNLVKYKFPTLHISDKDEEKEY